MSYEACYGVQKAVYFDKTHRGKPSLRFVEVDLTSKRKTKVRIGLANICPSGITLNFSFFYFILSKLFSEYARITDGNSTEVLYHRGCDGSFAPEIFTDVQFGLSNNISVQVYTEGLRRGIKIKFAILKNGLTSG